MEEFVKKNGLIFTSDFKCVLGIDSDSDEFTGNVPNGVERIEEEAFSCCSIKRAVLPDSVTYVGANLFCNSTELEYVRLPSGLKELSAYMFCGCSALKKIDMPYEVNDFPEGLFAGCSSLEEVPFRAGIKIMPEGVLDGCTAVRSLVIPDTVTKICSGAITNCTSLSTIVLPAALEIFEQNAVYSCPGLTRIRISEENKFFRNDDDGGCLYRKNDDGSESVVFTVPVRVDNVPPAFNEINDTETVSILTFDDEDEMFVSEDMSEADEVVLAEDTVPAGGMPESDETSAATGTSGANFLENHAESAPDNKPSSENVEERLAEIMGQGKQYGAESFSIMDIPQASDEEIAASCLKTSCGVAVSDDESEDMSEADEVVLAEDTVPAGGMPESDAMTDFCVNPADSCAETCAVSGVESEDEPSPDAVPVRTGVARIDEEKTAMHGLMIESEKVEQQVITNESDKQRILYVFAQELCRTPLGKKISARLVKCCSRLAEIHKYTSIFYFYGIGLEKQLFRSEFISYMQDKDVVVACSEATLSTLDGVTKDFAQCAGIVLEKDEMLRQAENAKKPGSGCLKLLIQDNLN